MKTKININDLKEQLRKEILSEHQNKLGKMGWEANKKKYKDISAEMRRRMLIGREKNRKYWEEYKKNNK